MLLTPILVQTRYKRPRPTSSHLVPDAVITSSGTVPPPKGGDEDGDAATDEEPRPALPAALSDGSRARAAARQERVGASILRSVTTMTLRKRQPTDDEKERFIELVAAGQDPYVAAREVDPGLTASRFRDVLDPEWQERYAAAKQEALEARAATADQRADEWVNDPDCPPAVRIVWLKRWNREFSERYHLAVERELGQDAGALLTSPPQIVVDFLTDAEMEELEACVARVHALAALARERTVRPAGEVEAA